jgi:hypothetical protein
MRLDINVSDKLAIPIFRAHFYLQDGKNAILATHRCPYKTIHDVTKKRNHTLSF